MTNHPSKEQRAGKRPHAVTDEQKRERHFVQIHISGVEGSGKTTVLHLIGQCLHSTGFNVHLDDDGEPRSLVDHPYVPEQILPNLISIVAAGPAAAYRNRKAVNKG